MPEDPNRVINQAFKQSAHAARLKAERGVMDRLGVTHSQARKVLHSLAEADQRARVANIPAHPLPPPLPAPVIQRVVQELPKPKIVDGIAPALIQANTVYTSFVLDLPLPSSEGKYDLVADGLGGATWELDTVPNVPDAIPGEDIYYGLRRDSSADPVWAIVPAEVPISPPDLTYLRWYNSVTEAGEWVLSEPFDEPESPGLFAREGAGAKTWTELNFVTSAVVDTTTTLSAGSSATASVTASSTGPGELELHFDFGIPTGPTGPEGPPGGLTPEDVDDILRGYGLIP